MSNNLTKICKQSGCKQTDKTCLFLSIPLVYIFLKNAKL